MPVIYYESDSQIIIGVTLEDGRRFSIDLFIPKEHKELLSKNTWEEFEILASGSVDGRSAN